MPYIGIYFKSMDLPINQLVVFTILLDWDVQTCPYFGRLQYESFTKLAWRNINIFHIHQDLWVQMLPIMQWQSQQSTIWQDTQTARSAIFPTYVRRNYQTSLYIVWREVWDLKGECFGVCVCVCVCVSFTLQRIYGEMIIVIIFINYNLVVTRWQWLFYLYTKYEIGYYWI